MKRWLLRFLVLLLIVIFIVPFVIPLPTLGADPATFADPDGRFVTVNGLETYVRESGDPDGVPVMLLHGWGASTYSWRETIPALAGAGYRVIAFDRPPYGLSAKTGELPFSQAAQADFTVALMDELGIERAVLVGHSMGGGVIGYVGVNHPDRVLALAFVSGAVALAGEATGGGGMIPPALNTALNFAPINRWARILVRTFVRPEMFADLQRSAYYDSANVTPDMLDGYTTPLKVEDWDAALLDVLRGRSFSGDLLTAEQLGAIPVPTAILWGENDTWVPLARGERLREVLPDATWITYPETGHLPMEEHPADFNRDLIAFIAQKVSQDES